MFSLKSLFACATNGTCVTARPRFKVRIDRPDEQNPPLPTKKIFLLFFICQQQLESILWLRLFHNCFVLKVTILLTVFLFQYSYTGIIKSAFEWQRKMWDCISIVAEEKISGTFKVVFSSYELRATKKKTKHFRRSVVNQFPDQPISASQSYLRVVGFVSRDPFKTCSALVHANLCLCVCDSNVVI